MVLTFKHKTLVNRQETLCITLIIYTERKKVFKKRC